MSFSPSWSSEQSSNSSLTSSSSSFPSFSTFSSCLRTALAPISQEAIEMAYSAEVCSLTLYLLSTLSKDKFQHNPAWSHHNHKSLPRLPEGLFFQKPCVPLFHLGVCFLSLSQICHALPQCLILLLHSVCVEQKIQNRDSKWGYTYTILQIRCSTWTGGCLRRGPQPPLKIQPHLQPPFITGLPWISKVETCAEKLILSHFQSMD